MNEHELQSYIEEMSKPGTWGDGIMLSAAVNCYSRPVIILTAAGDSAF